MGKNLEGNTKTLNKVKNTFLKKCAHLIERRSRTVFLTYITEAFNIFFFLKNTVLFPSFTFFSLLLRWETAQLIHRWQLKTAFPSGKLFLYLQVEIFMIPRFLTSKFSLPSDWKLLHLLVENFLYFLKLSVEPCSYICSKKLPMGLKLKFTWLEFTLLNGR